MIRSSLESVNRLWINNPVTIREMTAGLRERRIFVMQTVFLSVLSGLVMLLLFGMSNEDRPDVGEAILHWVFLIQWLLVLFMAPSLVCGSVSGEREKKTLEMLLASLLTPVEILMGKVNFALSYILLLVVSSLPITATVFFMGGVSPMDIFTLYLLIVAAGFLSILLTLFFSAREQRTASATNLSYLVTVLAVVAGLFPFFSSWNRSMPDILFGTTDYHGLHIWHVVPYFVLLMWFVTLLFTKARGFIAMSAEVVLTLQKSFQYAYIALLALVSMGIASGLNVTAAETGPTMAGFWEWLLVLNLFFQGTFLTPPVFPSARDTQRYARHVASRRWFFPAFFVITSLIPYFFFRSEGLDASQLLSSVGVMAIFCLSFAFLASSISHLVGKRLSRPVIYYALFTFSVGIPLIFDWIQMVTPEAPGLISFYYAGPFKAMHSIWVSNDMSDISVGNEGYPVFFMSLVYYAVLSTIFGVLAVLHKQRAAHVV